jgi:SAM-dependent methyltransferase
MEYGARQDGWTDELSALHEDAAGADHPMDRASRSYAMGQLAKHVGERSVILEVGCSSGYLLLELRRRFQSALVIGSDSIAWLHRVSHRVPGVPLLRFDLTACPLPDATVDAVVALNVLEHIADDFQAMRHIARILRPNGIAVIELPAGPHLYDSYDRSLNHFRRYSMKDAKTLVGRAGLSVLRASHIGASAYPAFALLKQIRRLLGSQISNLTTTRLAIERTRRSRGLAWCLAMELAIGRVISYPFGIRCVLTCQKPASQIAA